jgi:hypothetical protein
MGHRASKGSKRRIREEQAQFIGDVGEHYRWLNSGGLDEQRLAFSTLAMRLSLIAGPLRLLDGDFPDRDAMMGIAEHNLRQTLAFLLADDR